MRPSRDRWSAVVLHSALLITGTGACAFGQEGGGADDREARSAEMSGIARSLTVSRVNVAGARPVTLRPEPLLRWNDATRRFSDASLWAWGGRGRPLVVLALELYPSTESGAEPIPTWAYELISLSDDPLEVKADDGRFRWAPSRSWVTFRAIPGAPMPADSPAARLAQMGEQVKRFAATEHPRGDVVLRLMPRPVCRYADPAADQVDGAIYLLATGTNPEVLIVVEAQGPAPERATWRYAVARLTSAAYEVTLDRREVWREPYPGKQKDPNKSNYFTVQLPRRRPGG